MIKNIIGFIQYNIFVDCITKPIVFKFAENIYNDNFDLAAYITDNDFDFQTTVDHTDDILNQIASSTIDHCSTSQMLVSASTVDPGSLHATPSISHQSFGFGAIASTASFAAAPTTAAAVPISDDALFVDPSDTYHYVEQWLESCLQDEKSTVETINAVAGVMGVSPIKLDRELIESPAVFLGDKTNLCQAVSLSLVYNMIAFNNCNFVFFNPTAVQWTITNNS